MGGTISQLPILSCLGVGAFDRLFKEEDCKQLKQIPCWLKT